MAVACDVANSEIVELLLAYGATGGHIEGSGWSPLMTTLFHYEADDVKIVRPLLENGADSEYCESDVNPVFQAAWMRPWQSDREEKTELGAVVGYDEDAARDITEIVKMLLGERSVNILDSSNRTLLMRAAQSENLYLVQYLLEAGCPTDAVNAYGKTALDYAKETGNPELIALLSENGNAQ